jgi:hypothetical protein
VKWEAARVLVPPHRFPKPVPMVYTHEIDSVHVVCLQRLVSSVLSLQIALPDLLWVKTRVVEIMRQSRLVPIRHRNKLASAYCDVIPGEVFRRGLIELVMLRKHSIDCTKLAYVDWCALMDGKRTLSSLLDVTTLPPLSQSKSPQSTDSLFRESLELPSFLFPDRHETRYAFIHDDFHHVCVTVDNVLKSMDSVPKALVDVKVKRAVTCTVEGCCALTPCFSSQGALLLLLRICAGSGEDKLLTALDLLQEPGTHAIVIKDFVVTALRDPNGAVSLRNPRVVPLKEPCCIDMYRDLQSGSVLL